MGLASPTGWAHQGHPTGLDCVNATMLARDAPKDHGAEHISWAWTGFVEPQDEPVDAERDTPSSSFLLLPPNFLSDVTPRDP